MKPARRKELKLRLIDQQNRVALPGNVLDALGAKAGDYVSFEISGRDVRVIKVSVTAA
jgi:bifunctional DNA-binding transcriptional regulator/antitoxin component of YhaV-PrlF toxin-antitoxin module